MLYGGGSIKSNGIYDQAKMHSLPLKWLSLAEYLPIPNTQYYWKPLQIIKTQKITFLLAIGGAGSVIDGTKFWSAAAAYEGETPWEILTGGKPILKGMPFLALYSPLPATGSEMNSGFVLTRKEKQRKNWLQAPSLVSAVFYSRSASCELNS